MSEARFRYLTVFACVVALIAAHAPLIAYRSYANVDEAYAAALAERLNEGFRLYEGAVSQRGPLFYHSFAALLRLGRWDDVALVRVAILALSLAQVLLVATIARRLWSDAAGIIAAFLATYSLIIGLPVIDGMALHAEAYQTPFLLLGAAAGVRGSRSLRWIVVSGLAFGAALAIKQSAILQPLPVVVWIFANAPRGARWRSIAAFAASLVAIPLAFLADAAANGTLGAFWYYTITYNFGAHLRPAQSMLSSASMMPLADAAESMPGFVITMIGVTVAWARALRRTRVLDDRGYFTLHFLVATLSASAMYRFFPHYYVPAIGFLALAVAGWTHASVPRAWLGVFAGALLVLATFRAYTNEKSDGRVAHDQIPQRLGTWIAATTPPDARVFVWGFSPWLYGYSHRRPAGRYVFSTYVTGLVPWFYDSLATEPSRIVPGSQEALLGDLAREDPELVIDAGSVELARPLRAYPRIASYLDARFCFEVRVGAYDVYRRRPASGCATEARPLPHAPLDWTGKVLVVPTPDVPDAAALTPLCSVVPEDVSWFDDEPPPPRVELLVDPARRHEPYVRCVRKAGPRD